MKRLLVVALLLYALPLLAQTYEWTDERGTVNFTEDLGRVPKKFRKKVKVLGEESAAPQVTEIVEPVKGGKAVKEGAADQKAVFAGKEAKWWRSEFGSANAELKAAEKDLVELRGRMADTSQMSRAEYLTLQNSLKHAEYRVLQQRKKVAEIAEKADQAGVPSDLRE